MDVATLVAKVQPSVVNITAEVEARGRAMVDPFDFFGQGPGQGLGEGAPLVRRQAQGSGFIVDPAGHVITNAHVVAGATEVKVRLADEREFRAHVQGRDEKLDVALLQIEGAKNLPAAALGSSEGLRVGDYVVAIGNPFGLGHTVTMGIVSAKSRSIGAGPYDDFIQTDASINPGNSGGPLFNLRGEVIGINTAINPRGQGIGFAIPVDEVKDVVPQLLASGHVERGRLGVVIQSVDAPLAKALGLDRPRGALIADVERGGSGARAGLKPGDVVLQVDGADVPSARELPRLVARHAPGSHVALRFLRDKTTKSLDVTLDALRESPVPASAMSSAAPAQPSGLGVQVEDAPGGGAAVVGVVPRSAADGELAPGDVIVEVNHRAIADGADLKRALTSGDAAAPVLLKVRREGQTRFVALERAGAN